jgi:hypothetical protein
MVLRKRLTPRVRQSVGAKKGQALACGLRGHDLGMLATLGSSLSSNAVTVTLIVAPVNDLPVTSDIELEVDEDTQLIKPGGTHFRGLARGEKRADPLTRVQYLRINT